MFWCVFVLTGNHHKDTQNAGFFPAISAIYSRKSNGWEFTDKNYLEKHYDNFNVKQVFPEPYSGEIFPGYENVNHPFHMLEPIFQKEKLDWYAALRNVKGVYLISDKSNGRKYVGSAYGDSGIWQRWACYIGTGHGWNDELTHVIRKEEIDYARKNFVFIILDTMPMNTIDEKVIGRESFWKEALCSRSHGYNKN